ncbi:MAG: nitrous oxide reductase accessory protein NosL [Bacteroidia bacterium]|nr:nitrous oxide reductase accessory protein NosL [Bacteroidia bacterium]
MSPTISKQSKILYIVAAIAVLSSIFVPIWRIELDAPQYPEGLVLKIHADKLAGDVDIINGLNHYIGMQTLHAENFIEFSILKYIIIGYFLIILLAGLSGKKKFLYIAFWAFVAFGVIAMVDFWRWEYNYGHNLDPNAAIVVPGMAYQPPLIGFKQLLNFGAFSVPDIGGWLFVVGGLLMFVAVITESGLLDKYMKKKTAATMLVAVGMLGFSACSSSGPSPIKLNSDKCDFCSMAISDGHFGAELITKKGRVYKFDDLKCMLDYTNEKSSTEISSFYVHNYLAENTLIDATLAFYVQNEDLRSPMGGNWAAFENEQLANDYASKISASVVQWDKLN